MSVLNSVKRALVIAPHPDDEVLGCGGTIARLAAMSCEVHVLIATTATPHITNAARSETLRNESLRAQTILGAKQLHFLDLPAAKLSSICNMEMNRKVGEAVDQIAPDTLLIPFVGDLHVDHQRLFTASLVAARPVRQNFPSRIWSYETLSETNWGSSIVSPAFSPTLFVNIESTLDQKVAAMNAYRSQVRPFPHERSIEALTTLARYRGATVHCKAAESFVVIRDVA